MNMSDTSNRKRKSESIITLDLESKIKKNDRSTEPATHYDVDQFAANRVVEIQALTDLVKNVGGNHQAFQKLPHHLRRRAMSHNIKRVPRRLHDVVKTELNKVKNPNKRPSRKYRRKPSNLLSEYQQRKRRVRWLDTHIWHAKRFKMEEVWGYKLPLHPTDKSIRSCYRAVQRHCLLQDVSYESYIEVKGKRDIIVKGLCHLTSNEIGPTFAAKMTCNGTKEGSLYLYSYDSYPHKVIGRVTYLWHPESRWDSNGDLISTLWIGCHPSFESQALTEIGKCFNKTSTTDDNVPDTDMQSDLDCSNVSVTSLKHEIVKFRLFGPASNLVLKETLKVWTNCELCPVENGKLDQSFVGKDKIAPCSEERDVGQKDDKIVTKRDKIVDNKEEMETSETMKDEMWWKWFYQSAKRQGENTSQIEALSSVLACSSPGQAPPHTVMAATVRDPRLLLPPKRNKVTFKDAGDLPEERLKAELFTKDISTSALWDRSVRVKVKDTKILEKTLNDMKSKRLVPGTKLELGERESRIPIILIQRPGLTDSHPCTKPGQPSSQHQIGYASGWDILLPAGWAMAFWVAMVYRGARVGGQREVKAISLQARQLVEIRDVPDSSAGKKKLENESLAIQTKYNRQPPAKRPNYAKLGFDSPFVFPFESLCKQWMKKELKMLFSLTAGMEAVTKHADMYVLRHRHILKMLQSVLTNSKGFLQPRNNSKNNKDFKSKAMTKQGCLLGKVLSTEEGKALVSVHRSAMVPVSVRVLQRGVPARNALICIPSKQDLNTLRKTKNYGGPEESLHIDEDAPRRKAERKERLKLRKKKKRGKKVGKDLPTKVFDGTGVKDAKGGKRDGPAVVTGDKVEEDQDSCKFAIDKTSRSVIGFVTVGDFDLGQGQGVGMGFCSVLGLLHLMDAMSKNEGSCLALVRNPSSLQYRFGSISVVL